MKKKKKNPYTRKTLLLYIYIARETRASGVHVVIIYRRNTARLYGGPGVFIADADPGFRYAAAGRSYGREDRGMGGTGGRGREWTKNGLTSEVYSSTRVQMFIVCCFFVPRFLI